MALLQQCSPGPQADLCPRTTDDALPAVLGLLPPGPAWSGASIQGTVQNTYWRAYASVLAYTYGRLCDYVEEFFCATVNESRDQWIKEFGLDDLCDPYGNNLCLKVAAQGGASCDYFVTMAALSGWTVTCHDVSKDPEPIAGCFEVGCTPLGPTPVYNPFGGITGYGQRYACDYGEVTHHPDPGKWQNGKTFGASCPVPGSNLGQGPDVDESCCFIVGWYEPKAIVTEIVGDYCRVAGDRITFDCPRVDIPSDRLPTPSWREVGGFDTTGNYIEFGLAHVWEVGIDLAASRAAQIAAAPPTPADETISAAGNFMVGDITPLPNGLLGGSPLCFGTTPDMQPSYVLCFLDQLKPAHTLLNVKVIQP